MLHCKVVSHWLPPNPEWSLHKSINKTKQCRNFMGFTIKLISSITVTSYLARWLLKSPTFRLFTQPFVQGQIKENQSSASMAFVRGIHRWPMNSPHKGPVTRKIFPFNDVIMESCTGFRLFLHCFVVAFVVCLFVLESILHTFFRVPVPIDDTYMGYIVSDEYYETYLAISASWSCPHHPRHNMVLTNSRANRPICEPRDRFQHKCPHGCNPNGQTEWCRPGSGSVRRSSAIWY